MSTETLFLNNELYKYMCENSIKEPEVLQQLRESTKKNTEVGHMMTSPEQVQFMTFIAKAINAKSFLEVGTFTGYTSLAMAMSLPEDGKVTTCEKDEDWIGIGKKFWQKMCVESKIEVLIGDAKESLAKLIENNAQTNDLGGYDIAYIDADKRGYSKYFSLCYQLVKKGGIIMIDNVFQGGKVTDYESNNNIVEAIKKFNQEIYNNPNVMISMVPLGDGLTLAYKK